MPELAATHHQFHQGGQGCKLGECEFLLFDFGFFRVVVLNGFIWIWAFYNFCLTFQQIKINGFISDEQHGFRRGLST